MVKWLNYRQFARNIIGQSVTLNREIVSRLRDFCHAGGVIDGGNGVG
jgi:hypothetical protein